MNLVSFFIAISVLFTASAIPMQQPQESSSVPDPDYVPKVDFGQKRMLFNDKMAAKDIMINHYKGLEPGNDHKEARLAFAKKGWRDGKGIHNDHMQYLNFDYHRGDTPDSAKIGQTVTISRVRPPPETHFSYAVPKEHRLEITQEINTKFKALAPDQAARVRSMKALSGWGEGPGLREEAQFTFHRGVVPEPGNTLWNPVKIYRPMSFHMDGVPENEAPVIKKRIREEHENLDDDHPLKQANYGVVTQGWQKDAGPSRSGRMVDTTLYKVKDKLTDSAEEDFEKIGHFPVALGKNRKAMVTTSTRFPSSKSTTKNL